MTWSKLSALICFMFTLQGSAETCDYAGTCFKTSPRCLVLAPTWDNIDFVQKVVIPMRFKVTYRCERQGSYYFREQTGETVLGFVRRESHQLFRTPQSLSEIDPQIQKNVTAAAIVACGNELITLKHLYQACR
jgi:hypothetical protein